MLRHLFEQARRKECDLARVSPEAAQHEHQLRAALGQRVRSLRRLRNLTLERLASRCHVSVGMLSQIEQGKANPSFLALQRIAVALDVPVARLVHVGGAPPPVVRHGQGRRLNLPTRGGEDGVEFEMLVPDMNRALLVLRLTYPPGAQASDKNGPGVHVGEETCIVLRGKIEVHLDSECYTVCPGDSISFDSTTPHRSRNPGPEEAETIWAITPPVISADSDTPTDSRAEPDVAPWGHP